MLNMVNGVCALCKHNRVIRCWPIDHGHGANTFNVAAAEARVGLLGNIQQYGLMVAYCCQRCGFVAWFANKPEEIPIGDEYGTSLVEGPPAGA